MPHLGIRYVSHQFYH